MARQANGTYQQPANTSANSGATISSTAFNTLISDIGTELTNSLDRQGRSAMTAALPMGANKITGLADPTVSTDAATKNYVDTTTAAFFSTGDVKLTIKTSADSGWVMCNDGTIGSATSNATTLANSSTQALFTLIFNNITDAYAPIFTSGGGATTRAAQTNAASAWAANCSISLTKMLGRALALSGSGSGLTARSLGQTLGEENHQLTLSEIPTGITSSGSNSITVTAAATAGGKTGIPVTSTAGNISGGLANGTSGSIAVPASSAGSSSWSGVDALTTSNTINVTSNNTGNAGHNNMQPTSFLNAMIKL